MKDYVVRMVEEHKNLVINIEALNTYVFTGKSAQYDNAPEQVNKAIQLRGMKMYEEALRARLNNVGVCIANGEYFEHIEFDEIPTDTENSEEEDFQYVQDGGDGE